MPTIASLNVNLTASIAQFNKNMQSASKTITAIGTTAAKVGAGMAAFGGSITGALTVAVKQFAATGDALDEMSTRTGIATESLSALSYAASFSSVSMEQIGQAVAKMQRTLVDTPRKISELGINLQSFTAMRPEQQIGAIADAINRLPTAAQKTAAAMGVFGKSGASLLPFLAEGSSGIGKLTAEAQRLGITMDAKTAKAAAKLDDALTKATTTIKALVVKVGAALAPAITNLFDRIEKVIPAVVKWVENNQELIVTIAKVGFSLVAVGTTITIVGGGFVTFGAIVGGVGRAVVALAGAFKVLTMAIASNPIGLIAVVWTTWFLTATDAGQKLLDKVNEIAGAAMKIKFPEIPGFGVNQPVPDGKVFPKGANPQGRAQFFKGKMNIGEEFMARLAESRAARDAAKDAEAKNKPLGLPTLANFADIIAKPLNEIGKAGQFLVNEGINTVGQVLLKNGEKFFGKDPDKTPSTRGPDLIEAGSREAFNIGRNRSNKAEDKTEENTRNTYKAIVNLANQLSAGLKIDIQNIESFAP